jgi:CubicO group peptidase (beta-lactamase class C family)
VSDLAWRACPVVLLTILALGASALPFPVAGEADPLEEVSRELADRAFREERWGDAAQLYRALYERDPEDWEAVARWALSLHRAGEWERSIEAHREAARFPQARPAALYNIACARARLGQTDRALKDLRLAIRAGFDDAETIGGDEDLAAIRDDPRFGRLLWGIRGSKHPPITFENLEDRMAVEALEGFSGSVLVQRDGEVVLSRGYGWADREHRYPNDEDTIYAIGSTPIDFTKAGILLLAQEGGLRLDDPLARWIENVPEDKRAITIEHLMTGRSGLRDFHDVPGDRDPDHAWIDRDEAVRRVFAGDLLFEPGTSRQHSHSAWVLLAAVIEIASGRTYPEFTRERLFEPAGMSDTRFFGEEYPEERMAIGYGSRSDGDVNAPAYWGPTSWLVMGSGGQVSTVLDLHRWNRTLRGGEILTGDWLERYWSPPGSLLSGGDAYGYEILYTEGPEDLFFLVSHTITPENRRQFEQLGRDLADLVLRAP